MRSYTANYFMKSVCGCKNVPWNTLWSPVIIPHSLGDGYHCSRGTYYLHHHFEHYDGGSVFLWHVGNHLSDYTVSFLQVFTTLSAPKLYSIKLVGWLINWKGFGRKQLQSNWGTIMTFVRWHWGKPLKPSGVPTEILTKHLLNTSLCHPLSFMVS
jgi:hypothetical protein